MKTVIAIGGNALVTPGADGNINDQFAHSRRIAQRLAELVQKGWHLTITHGNKNRAAQLIRMNRTTMLEKMKKKGVKFERFSSD